MKLKRFIAVILCIVLTAGYVTTASATVNGYDIYSVLDLKVGETVQYTSKDSNGNTYTGWTSTNPKVASVTTDGFCTALSAGEAIMELTMPGDFKIGRKVVVTEPEYKLSKSKLSLYVGGKATLKLSGAVGTVKWTSSDTKVATVSSKGVVTAKKAGKATVAAKISGKSFKCAVTVKTKPVKLSQSSVTLNAGKKFTLKVTGASGKVKWSSSKKSVATVSSKGVVTAKKAGKAVIYAKVNGKTCKCAFTVKKKNAVAKTVVGSKTVTESNNVSTIGKVKTSLDPAMLKKNAKLTLKSVSNLPKLSDAKMKAYDFSLSGAKVSSSNVAVLEIPLTLKKGQQAVAGYYNEKKKKWESVPCSYSDGKVSIIASHFSTYGAGAVSSSYFVYNDGTTMEKLLSYWAPASPSITGEEALKVTSESLKNGSVASKCVEWGWDALNKLFDNNVNRKANLYEALGFHTKFSNLVNNYTSTFGAIGFALAYIDAIKYAYQGDHQQAAYYAYNGCSGAVTALLAQQIGTQAIAAGCFAISFISYYLIESYQQALTDNEAKWYKYYKYYYTNIKPRKPYQWKDMLLPIISDKNKTFAQIKKEVEAIVDNRVQEAWDADEFDYYFYEATGIQISKGGLNSTIKNKLSAQYKHELMNGDVTLVYKWYATSLQKKVQTELNKTTEKIAKEFNQEFKITFYDGQLKKGKTSKYAGYTVRFKNISSKLKDKKNLTLKLNSKGQASTTYTLFAAVKYNIKPTVELVNKSGKVVKTFTYKINSKTTKVNINPKTASTKNKWVLSSTENYSFNTNVSSFKKLGSTYTINSASVNEKYSFTFKDTSVTTKYERFYTNTDNTYTSATFKADFTAPKSTISPGDTLSLSSSLKCTDITEKKYGLNSHQARICTTLVNPQNASKPEYPWMAGYDVRGGAIQADANAGNSASGSDKLSVPKTESGGASLKKGDVFYLVYISYEGYIESQIVYKYVYS